MRKVECRERVVLAAGVALDDRVASIVERGVIGVRIRVRNAAGLRVSGVGTGDRERLRLRGAIGVARVEVDSERSPPEQPPLEPVALVAVRVAVLLRELGGRIVRILVDPRVAEGERIPLIVVVRLVLGVRVEELHPQAVREALVDAECNAPVPAFRRGLDRRHPADAVGAVLAESGRPGRAELRGVAVDESGQMLRVGPVVLQEERQVLDHLVLAPMLQAVVRGFWKFLSKRKMLG
jgi:hypothetical protein